MKPLPFFLILAMISGFIAGYSCKNHKGNKPTHSITQFTNGQILLPDYAHNDTLVVQDAASLNNAFDTTYNKVPETDQEINDALHNYCLPLPSRAVDYGMDVDSTGYTIWDNNRLVGHFPFDQNPILDSVIFNDND